MDIVTKIEHLQKWCLDNLKYRPNSTGLIELKSFLEVIKENVHEKTIIDNQINQSIEYIKQIKIGNTPKYIEARNKAIEVLQNVLDK